MSLRSRLAAAIAALRGRVVVPPPPAPAVINVPAPKVQPALPDFDALRRQAEAAAVAADAAAEKAKAAVQALQALEAARKG